MIRALAALLALAALTLAPARLEARAEEPPAAFVLVVGVNAPPSNDLPTLRYADDDAARYFDLFRALGAKTYLLASLDANTRRLHPQAAAEARTARPADLASVVTALTDDVARARARGLTTAFYLVYAGHGDVGADGNAFLGLDGGRLTGGQLIDRVVTPVAADASHVIVDACYSSLLITGRGAGGSSRPVRGFLPRPGTHAARVGFLLSTSSGRETHEWEGVQAGVFSHEVRSGLYGAADADRDGRVSYREIAAFVSKANEGIPNERFRPDVYARPPEGAPDLLDLRQASGGRIDVDGQHAGHWYLEDQDGVRLAEWHHGAGTPVRLLRPLGRGKLYLVSADGRELTVDPGEGSIAIAELASAPARVAMRGAATDSFERAFALPFEHATVAAYQLPPPPVWIEPRQRTWQRPAGWSALAAAGAASGVALYFALETADDREAALAATSQVDIGRHNRALREHQRDAWIWTAVAGAAAVSGALLLLLPDTTPGRTVIVTPSGVLATWSVDF